MLGRPGVGGGRFCRRRSCKKKPKRPQKRSSQACTTVLQAAMSLVLAVDGVEYLDWPEGGGTDGVLDALF